MNMKLPAIVTPQSNYQHITWSIISATYIFSES